jgi:hypothetical protein
MKLNNLLPRFPSVLLGAISVFAFSQPLMAQSRPPFLDDDLPQIDRRAGRDRPPFADRDRDWDDDRYFDRDRPPFLYRNRPPFADRDRDWDNDRYSDRDRPPFLNRY